MSGFTTTGATILDDIESLSHGMLFWRSLTQWIGGLGIVFFTIAVLPVFTSGGVQLFSAESTGVTLSLIHISPVLDVELTGKRPKKELQQNIKKWLDRVEAHYGVKPILYTSYKFKTRYLDDSLFNAYPDVYKRQI